MSFSFALTQFLNGISSGMNLFIIAAGLTIVLGVLRILNFAHGSLYMLGAYVSFTLTKALMGITGSFWLAVMGSTLAIGILGLVVERILLRFLYGKDHAYQLLFTFALVLVFGDLTRMFWGSNVLSVPVPQGLNGATSFSIRTTSSSLSFAGG
jgi:branched-subunit amino acid ABC-type transport system permease component